MIRDDFGDWMSPMLVKELRQGVRTRVFVSMFIMLQGLLLTITAFSLLVASVSDRENGSSAFFWIMIGLPVLVILPMGGLNAIGGEVKANTLELIFLTRLTAFRIVLGKWLAIFVQSLLLVCTVLPYLVLRYFIGGINISTELGVLAGMLALSAVLAACAVGISGYPTRLVRVISGLAGIVAFFMVMGGLSYLLNSRGVTAMGPGWAEWLCALTFGGILLLAMLEIGAAKIAPPAENHSATLRLLGFAALAFSAAVAFVARDSRSLTSATAAFALGLCILALCETPRRVPSPLPAVCETGAGRARGGAAVVPGLGLGSVLHAGNLPRLRVIDAPPADVQETASLVMSVSALGALLLPMALIRCCLPRLRNTAAFFFTFQFVCVLITVFCNACDSALGTHAKYVCAILPLPALIMAAGDAAMETKAHLPLVVTSTVGSAILLLAAMRKPLADMRADELASLDQPAPRRPPKYPMRHWPDDAALGGIQTRMQVVARRLRLPLRHHTWRGEGGNWQGAGIGSSIDFQDHRQYLPGDDPRYIDWQAYARTGHYSMKLYREEVSPRVDVALDVSASMLFDDAKRVRALELFYFCAESARQAGSSLRCYAVGPTESVPWELGAPLRERERRNSASQPRGTSRQPSRGFPGGKARCARW